MNVFERMNDAVAGKSSGVGVRIGFLLGFVALLAVPFIFSYSEVYTIAWMLTLGILVLGYNVLLGYTGLLSFGHGAFYGSGAYTVAMLLRYTDIQSMLVLLGSAVLFNLLLAAVIGILSLRSNEVYYALLTLALAQIIYIFVSQQYNLTQGTDGLPVESPHFLMFTFEELSLVTYLTQFYYFVIAIAFVGVVALLWRIIRSPFGLTLKTLRENSSRARSTGVAVNRYRWYATLVSGMVAGLAGGLFAILSGHVTPDLLNWLYSGEIVFMAVFGGVNTFIGPVVGAATYIFIRQWAVANYPSFWQLILGGMLFIVVIAFRDDGIWGTVRKLIAYARQWQKRR